MSAQDAQIRFQATLDDDVSAKATRLEQKLKKMGATPAEIKMMLRAYDEATPKIKEVQRQMDALPRQQIINIQANAEPVHESIRKIHEDVARKPIRLTFVDNLADTFAKLGDLRTRVPIPLAGAIPGSNMLMASGGGGLGIGAIAGMAGVVQQGVSVNAKMEQSLVTLNQTLKDSAQATAEMGKLVTIAQKTPFSYEDVLAADVRLRSYQMPTMQGEGGPGNKGWLSSAGNMAAAMNTPITQAVEAVADARQGYFVRMMSYGIRMMREDFSAGGKYAGMTYEQGLERALKRFEGAQELQSKTFTGIVSNLKDIAQQQVIKPLGGPAFAGLREGAQNMQDRFQSPEFQQRLGKQIEEVQRGMIDLMMQMKQGQQLFQVNFQKPIEEITKAVITLAQVFGQGFGFGAREILKTYAEAFYQILTPVISLADNKLPQMVVQFYAVGRAMQALGMGKIADPFVGLLNSLNPLTFSITGLVKNLLLIPGALTRLSVGMFIKRMLDARQATKSLNDELSAFGDFGDTKLGKINAEIDKMANGLDKSGSAMKKLVANSASGIPMPDTEGMGQQMRSGYARDRLQSAITMAQSGARVESQFGVNANDVIKGIQDEMKRTGAWSDNKDNQTQIKMFANEIKNAALVVKGLGFEFKDLQRTMAMYKSEAAALGMSGYGGGAALMGLNIDPNREPSLTKGQMGMGVYTYDDLRRKMLSSYAKPSIDMISSVGTGNLGKYWNFNEANLGGGIGGGESWGMNHNFRLRQSQYELNQQSAQRTRSQIATLAPSAQLPQVDNPWMSQGMGVDLAGIKAYGGNPGVQGEMVAKALESTRSSLDSITPQIQKMNDAMNRLNNISQAYSLALDDINHKMQLWQQKLIPYQRQIEDIQLAMSKYANDNVTPLQRQMNRLNNEMTIMSHTMSNAQYEMSRYAGGLITGEQAALNQVHALETYNKQLQLLQLQYTQIGATVGQSIYREGFSTKVGPLMGISLQMQMQRLQRRQQAKQLEYDLSFGEQHYQMQQAARPEFQRQEMGFSDRMRGIRNNTGIIDDVSRSQHDLANTQFADGQKMFKYTEHLADQQDAIAKIQITMQELTQSKTFRDLTDQQMDLGNAAYKVNKQITLQQQNIDKLQSTMDDLKAQQADLFTIFFGMLDFGGDDPYKKLQKMLDLFDELPQDMGGLSDEQLDAFRQKLTQAQKLQKEAQKKEIDETENWVARFKRTLFGLFTGDTWRTIGDQIKTGLNNIVGPAISGVIAGSFTTLATAGSILVGAGVARTVIRYGALSALQAPAGAILRTGVGRGVAGLGATMAGAVESRTSNSWLSERLSKIYTTLDDFAKRNTNDGSELVRMIKGNFQGEGFAKQIGNQFRLIRNLRGTVGGLVGGPIGRVVGEEVTFRRMLSGITRAIRGTRDEIKGAEAVAKAIWTHPNAEAIRKFFGSNKGELAVDLVIPKKAADAFEELGKAGSRFRIASDSFKSSVGNLLERLPGAKPPTVPGVDPVRGGATAGEVSRTTGAARSAVGSASAAQRDGLITRAYKWLDKNPAIKSALSKAGRLLELGFIAQIGWGVANGDAEDIALAGIGGAGLAVAAAKSGGLKALQEGIEAGGGKFLAKVGLKAASRFAGPAGTVLTLKDVADLSRKWSGGDLAIPGRESVQGRDRRDELDNMNLGVRETRVLDSILDAKAAVQASIREARKRGESTKALEEELLKITKDYSSKRQEYVKYSGDQITAIERQNQESLNRQLEKFYQETALLQTESVDSRNKTEDRGFKDLFSITDKHLTNLHSRINVFKRQLGVTSSDTGSDYDSGGPSGGAYKGATDWDHTKGGRYAHGGFPNQNILKGKGDSKGYLIRVGEEDDEMIIPLAAHRRERAKSLVKQAGGILGMAMGGRIEEKMPGQDMAYTTAKGAYDAASAFANGGMIDVKGSKPGFAALMAHFRSMFGNDLYVMSGNRPGSRVAGSGNVSNHASGNAIDISNPVSDQGTSSNPPPKSGLDNLYSYLLTKFPKPPRRDLLWRTLVGGNHFNHVHLGMDPSATETIKAANSFLKGIGGDVYNVSAGGAGGATGVDSILHLPGTPSKLKHGGAIGNILYRVAAQMRKQLNHQTGGSGTSNYSGGGSSGANVELGKKMAKELFGWSGGQFDALNKLWTGESGWRTTADNPTSDAYGIPQSLPGSKMASSGKDWATNPATQIDWGLRYIKGRYGDPANALKQWSARNPHWYASGLDNVLSDRMAVLHQGERVQGVAEAVSARAARGSGSDPSTRKQSEAYDALIEIKREIRKAKEALEDMNDRGKKEQKNKLSDLNAQLRQRWANVEKSDKAQDRSISKKLLNAGDESGGEATAALVKSEQRKLAIQVTVDTKADKALVTEMNNLRKSAESLVKTANTPREKRLAQTAVTATKRAQKSAKAVTAFTKTTKGKAASKEISTAKYIESAAKRGVNAALIKDVTGKALSSKKVAIDDARKKGSGKVKLSARQAYEAAAKAKPGTKAAKQAQSNLARVLDKGLSKNAQKLDKLRDTATKNAASARKAVSAAAKSQGKSVSKSGKLTRDEAKKTTKAVSNSSSKTAKAAAKTTAATKKGLSKVHESLGKEGDKARKLSKEGVDETKKVKGATTKADDKRDKAEANADKREREFQKKALAHLSDIASRPVVFNINNTATGASLTTKVDPPRKRGK